MFKCENVKKFIMDIMSFVFVFIVLVVIPAIGETSQHRYTQICQVYEVGKDYTTFIDPTGELWNVTDTNYTVGDTVKIKFDDALTDRDRTDDIILKVKRVK